MKALNTTLPTTSGVKPLLMAAVLLGIAQTCYAAPSCDCQDSSHTTYPNGHVTNTFAAQQAKFPQDGVCLVCEGGQPASRPFSVTVDGASDLAVGCYTSYVATESGGGSSLLPFTYVWTSSDGSNPAGTSTVYYQATKAGYNTLTCKAYAANGVCFAKDDEPVDCHNAHELDNDTHSSTTFTPYKADQVFGPAQVTASITWTLQNQWTWTGEINGSLSIDITKLITAQIGATGTVSLSKGSTAQWNYTLPKGHTVTGVVRCMDVHYTGTYQTWACDGNSGALPWSADSYSAPQTTLVTGTYN